MYWGYYGRDFSWWEIGLEVCGYSGYSEFMGLCRCMNSSSGSNWGQWVCMDQGYLRVSLSHFGKTNGPKFSDREDCSISTSVYNVNISSLCLLEIGEDYSIVQNPQIILKYDILKCYGKCLRLRTLDLRVCLEKNTQYLHDCQHISVYMANTTWSLCK